MASSHETFYQRLRNCLTVQAKYKEAFRNLRDALGGSQALQSFPQINASVSSMQNASSRPPTTLASPTPSTNPTRHRGILMSEEDVIFAHIDRLCGRVGAVLGQIRSLKQFHSLLGAAKDLKRPKREEVGADGEGEGNPKFFFQIFFFQIFFFKIFFSKFFFQNFFFKNFFSKFFF